LQALSPDSLAGYLHTSGLEKPSDLRARRLLRRGDESGQSRSSVERIHFGCDDRQKRGLFKRPYRFERELRNYGMNLLPGVANTYLQRLVGALAGIFSLLTFVAVQGATHTGVTTGLHSRNNRRGKDTNRGSEQYDQ
jgi:hypothetical protein